jgi:hypothetical protein
LRRLGAAARAFFFAGRFAAARRFGVLAPIGSGRAWRGW